MNESERMTDLILEAYQKCKDNGHRMDWRRYNNIRSDAMCIDCFYYVSIFTEPSIYVNGTALEMNCIKKGNP